MQRKKLGRRGGRSHTVPCVNLHLTPYFRCCAIPMLALSLSGTNHQFSAASAEVVFVWLLFAWDRLSTRPLFERHLSALPSGAQFLQSPQWESACFSEAYDPLSVQPLGFDLFSSTKKLPVPVKIACLIPCLNLSCNLSSLKCLWGYVSCSWFSGMTRER